MTKEHRRYAEQYAKSLTQEFINHPDWRGPNFTWQKFPDMVQRLARASATASADDIGELARRTTEQILKEKNLI
jgi:hypothetical protein